jgi:hypothetical protein
MRKTDADRQLIWSGLSASAAMLLFMARPLFTGEVPVTGDLFELHYPLRQFYAQALATGQRFDWMPSLFTGLYVVGEGQLGAYHPLHWLLYRMLPLDTAFIIEIVVSYPFMFIGTWLFLRRWCGSGPAVFGAMLATFCGFMLSHGVHVNMVAVVSHVPWLLWAIHRVFAAKDRASRLSGLGLIAILTGSQLMLGYQQSVWWSILIEAAYTASLAVTTSPRVRPIATVLGGKLLGAAVGAVQLLATLHALPGSVRVTYDESFATSYSLPPGHLLQLLNPYAFWGRITGWTAAPYAGDELAAYAGAVPLVLAVWWLTLYRRLRAQGSTTAADRFALCALAFGVVGLWLATGNRGGLYQLQSWVPMARLFRVPARYVLFTQLALSAVSAIAVVRLVQLPTAAWNDLRRALWAPWALAGASAVSAVWLASVSNDGRSPIPEGLLPVAIGPALFIAAAVLLTLAVRRVRFAIAGLVLLAACDHALYGLGGVVAWHDFETRERLLDFGESPPPRNARLLPEDFRNVYTLAGYRVANGNVGLTPAKMLDYRSLAGLRLAGVEYVHANILDETPIPGARSWSRDWYTVPAPLPRARMVGESRLSHEPARDIELVDVERMALVTRELELEAGASGHAQIVQDDPGEIRIRTTASGRQLLVVAESYDRGWIATVDGRPMPVERVNGDFIGCVVDRGEHVVLLQFRPAHLAWGRAISLSGLAAALLLLGLSQSRLVRAGRTLVRRPSSPPQGAENTQ